MEEDIKNAVDILNQENIDRDTISRMIGEMLDERERNAQSTNTEKDNEAKRAETERVHNESVNRYFTQMLEGV